MRIKITSDFAFLILEAIITEKHEAPKSCTYITTLNRTFNDSQISFSFQYLQFVYF